MYIKNNNLFCILFLLLLNCGNMDESYAQDLPKWRVGAYFAAEYSYRALKVTDKDNSLISNIIVPDRDTIEIYRITYNTGISLQRTFSRNLSLRSGLFINEKGFRMRKVPICRPGPPQNCKTGWAGKLNNVDSAEFTARFGYLSVPAILQYDHHFSKTSVGVFGGVALSYALFIRDDITEYAPEGESVSYVFNRKPLPFYYPFVYSLIMGVNLERQILPNYYFALEPTFQYVGPIYKPTGLRTNLFSLGLGFHLKYNLTKN